MIKHTLRLTIEERDELSKLIKTGKSSANKLAHARILLDADESQGICRTDIEISERQLVSPKTVQRVRIAAVEQVCLQRLTGNLIQIQNLGKWMGKKKLS